MVKITEVRWNSELFAFEWQLKVQEGIMKFCRNKSKYEREYDDENFWDGMSDMVSVLKCLEIATDLNQSAKASFATLDNTIIGEKNSKICLL